MRRNISISSMSLLPHSYGPGGPQRAIQRAGKMDFFNKIHLVPMVGWRKKDLLDIPPNYVSSFEGPWNKGTVSSIIGQVFKGNMAALLGPTLFGLSSKQIEKNFQLMHEYFPNAFPVDAHVPHSLQKIHEGEKKIKLIYFQTKSLDKLKRFLQKDSVFENNMHFVFERAKKNVPIVVNLNPVWVLRDPTLIYQVVAKLRCM